MRALADQFMVPESTNGLASIPRFERHGGEYTIAWTEPPVTMTFARIHDGSRGVHAEVTITHGGAELHFGELNLLSTAARETLVKRLDTEIDRAPWRRMLEHGCRETVRAKRQGEPMITLTGTSAATAARDLLPRLLYEGEATTIFADGDTGKSLVAMAIGVAMRSGVSLPCGLKPTRTVQVAYLDYERSPATADERLAGISAGLGIDPPPIDYKRMHRPLVADVADLAPEFSRRRIGLVIIDSLIFALAGGDGSGFHEPVTAAYTAMQRFAPAAVLVLNHITGADARGDGAARPFGGVFAFNGPSMAWHAKRDREITDATAIAFTCTKANILPRRPDPFGLRFVPGAGTITIYPFDLKEAAPAVVAGATLTYRVRLSLANGPSTPGAIAASLGADKDTVSRLLRRLRENGKAQERDGQWEIIA